MRRLFTAAILATGLALTLAACSSSSPSGPTPAGPAAPADPVATLTHSADALNAIQSHQLVSVKTPVGDLVSEGDTDPAAKTIGLKVTGPINSEIRVIGNDMWITVDGEAKPWVHVDVTKLPAESSIRTELEFKSNYGILAGITTAKEVSPGHFEGTADLKKAQAAMATQGEKDNMQSLVDLAGSKATAVPLTATLDDQHRLTELAYSVTSETSGATSASKVVISNIGKAVTVAKPPAGDVMEATAEMYSRF